MESVTLSGKDFKTIHNTLCELRNMQERLTGVISDTLAGQLQTIIQGFEQGLSSAYAQDSDQFDAKMDYYSSFQTDNGLKTIWSIFELPVHGFLAEHPFQGAVQVAYKQHWGERAVYKEIQGGTWADLYRAADAVILASGDDHHIFIESFVVNPQQPDQLLLTTGS